MKHTTDIAILGAGLAGLSTAYHLQRDYQIYERSAEAGGLCGSSRVDGFTFDHGPHLYFTDDAYVISLLEKLLKDNLLQRQSRPGQYYSGTVVPYPYTVNLHGLPAEVVESCLAGFRTALEPGSTTALPLTYPQWCYSHYGQGFAEKFMLPYARNYWAVDPRILNTEWIGNKILRPSLGQVEAGAQARQGENHYYYRTYRYPRHGGAGALTSALLEHVKTPATGMCARVIDPLKKVISFSDGSEVSYETLVSSLPVPVLVDLIKDVPDRVKKSAQALLCNSVLCILIGLDHPRQSDFSWIYFNDGDACFYRVSFPAHFSPANVPAGKGCMWVEVSYSEFKPVDKETIIDEVIGDLHKVGLLGEEDRIRTLSVHDLKHAYVIYDQNRQQNLNRVHRYLGAYDIHCCGRFGEWAYLWTHEVILNTRALSQKLNRLS